MIRKFTFILLMTHFSLITFAQPDNDQLLADQFYKEGEYEKAIPLYEKLFSKNPSSNNIYKYYISTLLALEDYEQAEKVIRKQIKRYPDQPSFIVDLGQVYAQSGNPDKATAQYEKAIESVKPDEGSIKILATNFADINELDFAVNSYLRGKKILGYSNVFDFELGQLYAKKGDMPLMISSMLDIIRYDPNQIQIIENFFQDWLQKGKGFDLLRTNLLKKNQEYPDVIPYTEMLIWVFIQQEDFENAFIQERALDKRMRYQGREVLNFARLAVANEQYDAAIKAYEYVISAGDQQSRMVSKMELLNTKKLKITTTNAYTTEDILSLKNDYEKLLKEYGKNSSTAYTIRDLANLEAFYLHNTERAINLLNELLQYSNLNTHFKSDCKLDLGDIYLIMNDVWEAMLLYGQVDKDFTNDPIGHEARLSNARLSYYIGDFEWAQTQLDVLKASTSKLIANDALDLSVFITENLDLDTTYLPLEMYAQAELLIFQNRPDRAFEKLDSLQVLFPDHTLTDDIEFIKAQMFIKQNKFEQAALLLDDIVNKHGDDIKGDDALFALANLYENKLGNPEKAIELYEMLILNYPDSTFSVEARKRYRELRGDKIN